MKTKYIYLVLSLLFISVSFIYGNLNAQEQIKGRSESLDLLVIEVDNEHWAVEKADGKKALKYNIQEGQGFILDANDYEFKIPASLNIEAPNLIMISIGERQQYGIVWESGKQRYIVSGETLRPLSDSKVFPGFKRGQEIVIMIGYLNTAQRSNFYPIWYSLAEVF